jgi:type I restriction enzyme S subunit
MSERWWREAWPARRLATLFTPQARPMRPELEVLSVYRDYGVVPKASRSDNFNRTPDGAKSYQAVCAGDLVVNRMKAWQGSLGISDFEGLVSPDYEVLAPITNDLDPMFAHVLLRSTPMIDEYGMRSTGIRPSQWRLYWEQMRTITIPVPPLDEQRAIANYLDHEIARIDTLVNEQLQLIELQRERRQAVIDLAFANEEKNNRVVRACLDVVDCPHTTPEVDDDGQFEAVRTASVRGGRYRPGNGLRVNEATWRGRNSGGAPSLGDILFAREGGSAGEAAMVPSEDICLGQRMVLLPWMRMCA